MRNYLSQKFRNLRRPSSSHETSDKNEANHNSRKRMSAADFVALPVPAEQKKMS